MHRVAPSITTIIIVDITVDDFTDRDWGDRRRVPLTTRRRRAPRRWTVGGRGGGLVGDKDDGGGMARYEWMGDVIVVVADVVVGDALGLYVVRCRCWDVVGVVAL